MLETVLYYTAGEEGALAHFYGEVLGLQKVGQGLTFRVGPGLLLLFDRDRSVRQSTPPPHGAVGSIHTCFVAASGSYETWKQRVASHDVRVIDGLEWDNGVKSFYVHDPAGNLLEIADGDLWPKE